MIRLYTPTPEDDFARSTRELADLYSRPQEPRRQHPDSIEAEPANQRGGAISSNEYELVEMHCTMPAQHALDNVSFFRGGFPTWQDTAPLPILAFGPQQEDPTPAEWLAVGTWEEAGPQEIEQRASLGLTLLLMLTTWALMFYLLARV